MMEGVFVAVLLSVSALSYESLAMKSAGSAKLVAICDVCCGLLLFAEAGWLMFAQTDLFAAFPAYCVAVTGSSLILGVLLLLLAVSGVSLPATMFMGQSGIEKDTESDSQVAVASAEVVESFEVSFVKEGVYGLTFSELEGRDQLQVKDIKPDGCVAKFNRVAPDSAIRVGDRITKINSGAATTSALAGMAEGEVIMLEVHRQPQQAAAAAAAAATTAERFPLRQKLQWWQRLRTRSLGARS
mmetsp:Transcript_69793/g.175794  ORF Transcript_69793/g.175794 Transcript_69793/m.175794 type:complete len:242 (+) Transcript_69793:2-727(+)